MRYAYPAYICSITGQSASLRAQRSNLPLKRSDGGIAALPLAMRGEP